MNSPFLPLARGAENVLQYSHQPARLGRSGAKPSPQGLGFRILMTDMKRVIAYIDGYNLYYGLLKGTPYKWLDLVAFVRSFLREDQELVSVKYFTAQIKTYPFDAPAVDRQKIYLQAISTLPLVTTVHGFYSKNKTLAPGVNSRCAECDAAKNGYVPIVKLEEKRSDVNLAVAALTDAYENAADSFFFFTGDSDQIGTIETLRGRLGKRVCVFNPQPAFSMKLKVASSYYLNIPRDLPASCQLPDEIPIGDRGNVLHRPSAWRGQQA